MITQKKQKLLALTVTLSMAIIGGVISAFWFVGGENVSADELGFTYLPIDQDSACCYGLQEVTGALVTEVTEGKLIDQAGIVAGDVIVRCNGAQIGPECSLLGMIKNSPEGQELIFDVMNNSNIRTAILPRRVE